LSAISISPLALIGIECAFDRYHPVDLVEHPRLGLAFGASSAWIFLCRSVTVMRSRRGICGRHTCAWSSSAGPEPRKQEIVWPGPGILAAGGFGFIRQHPVRAGGDSLLEFAVAGLTHTTTFRGTSGRSATGAGAAAST